MKSQQSLYDLKVDDFRTPLNPRDDEIDALSSSVEVRAPAQQGGTSSEFVVTHQTHESSTMSSSLLDSDFGD